jgi:hypothetical protein
MANENTWNDECKPIFPLAYPINLIRYFNTQMHNAGEAATLPTLHLRLG